MITELGKELRKIRIDQDERLLDMAERLEKSAAFVSAVEVGKKSPPSGFEEAVINVTLSTEQGRSGRQAESGCWRSKQISPGTRRNSWFLWRQLIDPLL